MRFERARGLCESCGRSHAALIRCLLRLAAHLNPHWSRSGGFLAAAEALAGNIDGAKQHLAKYEEVDPGMTIRRFAEERSSVPLDAVSPAYMRGLERILGGLRRAGMPEQ